MYVETALEGGRVLTVEPDNRHCWMAHKQNNDMQMWRLEDNGCLRNKAHMARCLGLESHTNGGQVYLQIDEGIDSQKWKYESKYIVNLVGDTYYYHYESYESFLSSPRATPSGWQMTCL